MASPSRCPELQWSGNGVKFTVQVADDFQKIDLILTCSVIERF
jgi:hypothetical protein